MNRLQIGIILGICTLLTGILNYISYPILLKHLSIADYAEFSVYMSISSIISIVPAGIWYAMMVAFRSQFMDIKRNRKHYYAMLWKYSIIYTIGIMLAMIVLHMFFGLTSVTASIFLVLTILPSLAWAFFGGMFQALEYFVAMSLASVIISVTRFGLILGVNIFPTIDMSLIAFLLPGVVYSLASIIVWYRILRKREIDSMPEEIQIINKKTIIRYVIITGIVIVLQNLDILIVRKIFDATTLALYSAIAVIAKFALVIIGILETIYSPILVEKTGITHSRKVVYTLIIWSIIGYIVAVTLLPYIGNYMLSILKWELRWSWQLWSSVGITLVSLGFFSLFSKVLIAHKVNFFWYIFVFTILLGITLFSPNLEFFTGVYACILTGMYIIVVYLLLRKQSYGAL